MRGFLEDLCFNDWIDKLRRSRKEALTDDMLLDSARLALSKDLKRASRPTPTPAPRLRHARDARDAASAESCFRRPSVPGPERAKRRLRH